MSVVNLESMTVPLGNKTGLKRFKFRCMAELLKYIQNLICMLPGPAQTFSNKIQNTHPSLEIGGKKKPNMVKSMAIGTRQQLRRWYPKNRSSKNKTDKQFS